MGEFRDYRLIIPGSVFIIFFTAYWIVSDAGYFQKQKLGILSSDTPISQAAVELSTDIFVALECEVGAEKARKIGVDIASKLASAIPGKDQNRDLEKLGLFFIGILITGFGASHLLSAPVVAKIGFPLQNDGREKAKLETALGIESGSMTELDLAAEMSLRIHSHAPQELCNFLARRLNTTYTCFTSCISIWCGIILSFLIKITYLDKSIETGSEVVGVLMLIVLAGILTMILFHNAQRAKNEHWHYVCKFIRSDVKKHPLDHAAAAPLSERGDWYLR